MSNSLDHFDIPRISVIETQILRQHANIAFLLYQEVLE